MAGPGRIGDFKTDVGTLQVLLFNFDVNVHMLKPEHRAWINSNVGVGRKVFKGQPVASIGTTQLLICGLASRTGSNALNWALAKNRALSVAAAIRARNVGDLKPVIQFGVGEEAARLAGLKDGIEDEKWRGVMLRFDSTTKTIPPRPVPAFRRPNFLLPRLTYAKYMLEQKPGKLIPIGDANDQRAERINQAVSKGVQYLVGAPPLEEKIEYKNYEYTVTKIDIKVEKPDKDDLYLITNISFDYEWGPQAKGQWHTILIEGKAIHSCSDDQLYEWLDNPVKAYLRHKW